MSKSDCLLKKGMNVF